MRRREFPTKDPPKIRGKWSGVGVIFGSGLRSSRWSTR